MVDDLDEVVAEFLVESYENLDRLDQDLVSLEDDPRQPGTLASVFRTIHTIKGTCGFLGYGNLERVTHVGESLLSRLRDLTLELDEEIMSGLLTMVDAVREMLGSIEQTGADGDSQYADLIELLGLLQTPDRSQPGARVPSAPAATPAPTPTPTPETKNDAGGSAEPDYRPMGRILVEEGLATPEQVDIALAEQSLGDARPLGEILIEHGVVTAEKIHAAVSRQAPDPKSALAESTIRVDVDVLDRLMNLVGELVLARNNILQHRNTADPTLVAASQRLDLVTGELQESVMQTRMQPIGTIWSRFPRLVRDLAITCSKQVKIVTEGEGTELDKTIIEAIKDPLTHVVRNAVDHGIESPEDRLAAGKPAEGSLTLRARHEGGQVIVEISDDGAGIDPAMVKAKALERGVITAAQAAQMSPRDAAQLIFQPGFSTAASVTNVSGRGVGMDVVKTNVEKIGGTVEVSSEPGRGTTLRVRIPLTLAIVPALLITSGGERYAIPQRDVQELVRLDGERARSAVELLHDTPVVRLRDRLLPLIYLREVLEQTTGEGGDTLTIAVLSVDHRRFGLVVDSVAATEEIVVKPLGRLLRSVPIFSGATIMGDGRVALILDVGGIVRSSVADAVIRREPELDDHADDPDVQDDRTPLLVVATASDLRVAIPLAGVARLEEIDVSKLEHSRGRDVVQYRGDIMPLIRVADLIGDHGDAPVGDQVTVVVHAFRGRQVGIVIERIVDIVEMALPVDPTNATLVIAERVTEVLDVDRSVFGLVGTLFDDLVEA